VSEHEQEQAPHTEARAGLASAVGAARPGEPPQDEASPDEASPDEASPAGDGEG
jgi:hypothetical protein